MVTVEKETPETNSDLIPAFQFHFRLFILLLTTLLVLAYDLLSLGKLTPLNIIAAATLLLYALLTYWLQIRKTNLFSKISESLAITDGLLIGMGLSCGHFIFLPSFLISGALLLTCLLYGGNYRAIKALIALVLGAAIGYYLINQQTLSDQSYNVLNVFFLASLFLVIGIQNFHSRRYQNRILEINKDLEKTNEEQRLYAYKLSRYLPKTVTDSLQTGKELEVKTERKRLTVFFSDIVGFSALAEELEAETLAELLNSYLSEMSVIAAKYHGTVDKFIGDAVMVLHGDNSSNSKGYKQDAVRSISMALAMKKRMHHLQMQWLELGVKEPLQIRIGINTGYCTVGTFGTTKTLDYTALGTSVNLASRLESAGVPGSILISHETWTLVKDAVLCRDRGKIKAKGFSHPIQVYEVLGLRKEMGSQQSYFAQNMNGFSLHLDTEQVKNYDKDRIAEILEKTARSLRNKHIG